MRTPLSSPRFSKRAPVQKARAPASADPAALATYIADMTSEMAKLAGEADMPMLCYFLNLARVEADFRARGVGDPHRQI